MFSVGAVVCVEANFDPKVLLALGRSLFGTTHGRILWPPLETEPRTPRALAQLHWHEVRDADLSEWVHTTPAK